MSLEELQLALSGLGGQCSRKDDILQLGPILSPAILPLLLSHQSSYKTSPSRIYNMSQISSNKKVRSSWKISDTSRVYPSEQSIREQKSVLPERFSPAKGEHRPSKIFTASKEKLSLLRGERSPRDASRTPSKKEVLTLSSHLSLKESMPVLESPRGLKTDRYPQLQSRQSLVLLNRESDSPSPRRKGVGEINYHLLKSQQDFNLQAIHQLRLDFIAFKSHVLDQLIQQKESISKIVAELTARIEAERMPVGIIMSPTSKEVYPSKKEGSTSKAAQEALRSIDLARQVEEVGSQFEQFTNHLDKKQSELKLVVIQQDILASPESKDITECKTPIEKLSVEAERVPERRSTPLDKCSQIVSTIGMLSEINSSPVGNKAKSIEKLNIQEYRQKLLNVSRSNDQLIKEAHRQPTKARQEQQRSREEGKLKGSFKLDKFYNAIEKLKEEVNQIRSINDMKQIKKLRILKAQE